MRKLVVLLLLFAARAEAQLPVVPGAFGYGMDTRAAYGCGSSPAILRVTSLANSGAGTLRAALEATGPRVVIFERSGDIPLTSAIHINSPCITVAGQTAPSPGITVRYYEVEVRTHDVLLQHFRVRPGWTGANCNEGLGIYAVSGPSYNVIFDHMSVSWGLDENIYVLSYGQADFTFWRSITSESLNQTPNTAFCSGQNEPGHGFLAFDSSTHVDMIQSITAHNLERNPYYENGTTGRVLNNIIYNWYKEWGIAMVSASNLAQTPVYMSAAGNRLIRGPLTVDPSNGDYAWAVFLGTDNNEAGNKVYLNDNTVTNDPDNKVVPIHNDFGYNPVVSSPPSEAPIPSGYTVLASTAVEAFVKARAGARPADRDPVDTRIISEITNRTQVSGWYPQTQDDVGGWPSLAVNTRSLTTPTSPDSNSGNGYTNLEVWLHGYSDAVENTSSPSYTESTSGTRVPPTGSITNSFGDVYTLAANAMCLSGFSEILRNGLATVGGSPACGDEILYFNGVVYLEGDDLNWYSFNGTTYIFVGSDPDPTPPPPNDFLGSFWWRRL